MTWWAPASSPVVRRRVHVHECAAKQRRNGFLDWVVLGHPARGARRVLPDASSQCERPRAKVRAAIRWRRSAQLPLVLVGRAQAERQTDRGSARQPLTLVLPCSLARDGAGRRALHHKPTPALNDQASGGRPTRGVCHMGRHATERTIHRLEDEIAFMETQRSRAQRRHQLAILAAEDTRMELVDYDRFLADLRAARTNLPGGIKCEQRRSVAS